MFDRLGLLFDILSCLLCDFVPVYPTVCSMLKVSCNVIVYMFTRMGFISTGST